MGNKPEKEETITIQYLNAQKYIRIFDKQFVENNENSCEIVYKGEDYYLSEFFETNPNEKLEIKLKRIGKITDMSHMFDECEDLESLSDI